MADASGDQNAGHNLRVRLVRSTAKCCGITQESCIIMGMVKKSDTPKLDSFDLRIMKALQNNNRLTSEQLGAIAGLSPTACQRRLKRLRDEKVIEGDVCIVSPSALGRHLTAIVQVTLERERADIIDRFKAAVRVTPEIMAGYYVTGEADFLLVVTAKDMEDFEQFTRRFFYENPDLKGFKTTVVIDRVKAGFALPIEMD